MRTIARTLIAAALAATGGIAAAQTYSGWDAAGRPAGTSVNVPAEPAGGVVVTYATRGAWTTASGIIAVETFDGGATAAGAVNTCTEPVSSASNDACFTPGQLAPGFSLTSSSGSGVVVLGTGFLGAGQTSAVVGANNFADFTTVTFAGGNVRAVALDGLVGNTAPSSIDVRVFNTSGAQIDTFSVPTTTNTELVFIGFISQVPVGRVELEGGAGSGELLDNLSFGSIAATAVPVGGATVVAILAGLVLLVGGVVLARRRSAAV